MCNTSIPTQLSLFYLTQKNKQTNKQTNKTEKPTGLISKDILSRISPN